MKSTKDLVLPANLNNEIRRGNVLLEDSPVAYSLLSSKRQNYCDGCLISSDNLQPCKACHQMYYCSKACEDAMQTMHVLECRQYVAMQQLPVAEIRLLLRLCCIQNSLVKKAVRGLMSHEDDFKADENFVSTFAGVLQTVMLFMGGKIPLSERELFILYCQLRINSFMITDHHGVDLAPGVFLRASRLDHACRPNVEYIFSGTKIICLALDDIKTISEARISYIDQLAATDVRRRMLEERYYFQCTCAMCLDEDRDRHISSLRCCESSLLSDSIPLFEVKGSDEKTFASSIQDPSDSVRCCPSCNTLYASQLVDQLSRSLLCFTEETPTPEHAADAIRLYCRMRGLKCPGKDFGSLSTKPGSVVSLDGISPAYYRLFGRQAHNVLLARVCRMACFTLLVENTESVLEILTGCDHGSVSRNRFNRLLISIGLDYLEWQDRWDAGPQLMIGLHAVDLAGFILRWLTDEQLSSEEFMKSCVRLTVSKPSVPNLAQLLCRLTLLAEEKLNMFAPYDSCIAESLRRLHSLM